MTLDEALQVLVKEHVCDFIYNIRERELKGWDGPRVKAWGEACQVITQYVQTIKHCQRESSSF